MRELAFLNKGIKIIFTDASLKKEKYQYLNLMEEFLSL